MYIIHTYFDLNKIGSFSWQLNDRIAKGQVGARFLFLAPSFIHLAAALAFDSGEGCAAGFMPGI